MNKVMKSLVKALHKHGINLDVEGLEMPVGMKHVNALLDSRAKLGARGPVTRKPQRKDRQEIVTRQKKARPAS